MPDARHVVSILNIPPKSPILYRRLPAILHQFVLWIPFDTCSSALLCIAVQVLDNCIMAVHECVEE